jgi:hypothetical protein
MFFLLIILSLLAAAEAAGLERGVAELAEQVLGDYVQQLQQVVELQEQLKVF